MNDFEQWWNEIGSRVTPNPLNDMKTHTKMMANLAWFYAERNLLIKQLQELEIGK